jgi:hypothetical protein
MSVPPSLGFFSEIMVLGPLLVYFFFLGVWLFVLFFFVGVYNIYLFCFMNHGEGRLSGNVHRMELREHFLSFFHFFPCFGVLFWIDLLFFFW